MAAKNQSVKDHSNIRRFYEEVYYKGAVADATVSGHLHRLASKIIKRRGQRVLDVGCGTGKWLLAVHGTGAYPVGIDLSYNAIEICRKIIPGGDFFIGASEELPFVDKQFHVVSCLGSLEHFLNPGSALKEMVRTARDDAIFLFLVPNADFLTYRLGFFGGTAQVAVKEDVLTLREWQELFETAGLQIIKRWRDLHVLSRSWITAGKWYHIPVRAVQALALAVWPLSWQYQVYHLCRKSKV